MTKIDWERFSQKYFLIIVVIITVAYGIESTLNSINKDDCIKMCLSDINGPDYRYTPIDVLPIPSGSSSVSHNSRRHSDCSCYNQNERDKSVRKADEQKEWYDKNL